MARFCFLVILALATPALSDTIDDAAAKARGVPVVVIQLENAKTRIEGLENKNDALRRQLLAIGAVPATTNSTPATNVTAAGAPSTNESPAAQLERAKGKIARLESEKSDLEAQLVPFELEQARRQSEAQQLKTEQERLQVARLSPLEGEVSVGQAGLVRRIRIVQVINSKEALVELLTPPTVTAMLEFRRRNDSLSETPPDASTSAWLTGFDTSTWTDGKTIDFNQPIKITKTKQYQTVTGGSRTVLLAEQL